MTGPVGDGPHPPVVEGNTGVIAPVSDAVHPAVVVDGTGVIAPVGDTVHSAVVVDDGGETAPIGDTAHPAVVVDDPGVTAPAGDAPSGIRVPRCGVMVPGVEVAVPIVGGRCYWRRRAPKSNCRIEHMLRDTHSVYSFTRSV